MEIAIELAHLHHYGAAVILSQRAHEQLAVELANEKHSDMITRQASKYGNRFIIHAYRLSSSLRLPVSIVCSHLLTSLPALIPPPP